MHVHFLIIRGGGVIVSMVQIPHQYSFKFATGGLEISCTLKFASHIKNIAEKAERLLESALGIK